VDGVDPVADAALDLDAVTADLAAVEAALERLDAGTYGRCLACDAPIDDEVLAAAPTQPTCAAHLPV
jgi:DnaK suppressor protein